VVVAKAERNREILMERVGGQTLEAIAANHGITRQMVHMVLVREVRRHVDEIELQMMVAAKEKKVFALAIPNQMQADRAMALDYASWVIKQLRRRDVEVAVETVNTPAGTVIVLTDVLTTQAARGGD
jgi:hypothetical protein